MGGITDRDVVLALRPFVRATGPVLAAVRDVDLLGLREREIGAGADRKAVDRLWDQLAAFRVPGTAAWAAMDVEQRDDWWANRLGRLLALLAAVPGVGGALADRLPIQSSLGAAGQGLLLAAFAGERGVDSVEDRVRLIAHVLFQREVDGRLTDPADRAEEDRRTAELTAELTEAMREADADADTVANTEGAPGSTGAVGPAAETTASGTAGAAGPADPAAATGSAAAGPQPPAAGPELIGTSPEAGSAGFGAAGALPGSAGAAPGSASTVPGSVGTGPGSAGTGPGSASTAPGSAGPGPEPAGSARPGIGQRAAEGAKAGVKVVGRAVWKLARVLWSLEGELDKRPQGRLHHQVIGMLPLVGAVGDYFGERHGGKRVRREALAWFAAEAARKAAQDDGRQ
ncbi:MULTISPECIES: hypothetical protein [Actinosynnema]|uniref:hypothetical protein n=1 Tax=Actinosynnema TaxID=40566 RepID=UPI0020A5EFF6|nr:hypothetical protein [Actinosynnema pretiosum]MCP2096111.1 hypothetical protein [Actinosynnema pretiosum]